MIAGEKKSFVAQQSVAVPWGAACGSRNPAPRAHKSQGKALLEEMQGRGAEGRMPAARTSTVRFLRHVQLGSLQLLFEEPHPRAEGGCRLSREEKVFQHLPQHRAAVPRPPAKKEELPLQEFPLKLSNEGLKTKMKKKIQSTMSVLSSRSEPTLL